MLSASLNKTFLSLSLYRITCLRNVRTLYLWATSRSLQPWHHICCFWGNKIYLKKKQKQKKHYFILFFCSQHARACWPHHRDRWDQEEGAHLQEHDRRGQRGQGRRPAEAGRHRQVRKVRARVPQHPRTYRRYVYLFIRIEIWMVRSWTSFILSSQSWEIGSPPTGGAGRMKLSCVVPASVIHIWPIHTSQRMILHLCVSSQCILTVCHILVECNHLVQTRNDILMWCGGIFSISFF